jgi:hypothetical protein
MTTRKIAATAAPTQSIPRFKGESVCAPEGGAFGATRNVPGTPPWSFLASIGFARAEARGLPH